MVMYTRGCLYPLLMLHDRSEVSQKGVFWLCHWLQNCWIQQNSCLYGANEWSIKCDESSKSEHGKQTEPIQSCWYTVFQDQQHGLVFVFHSSVAEWNWTEFYSHWSTEDWIVHGQQSPPWMDGGSLCECCWVSKQQAEIVYDTAFGRQNYNDVPLFFQPSHDSC